MRSISGKRSNRGKPISNQHLSTVSFIPLKGDIFHVNTKRHLSILGVFLLIYALLVFLSTLITPADQLVPPGTLPDAAAEESGSHVSWNYRASIEREQVGVTDC
jgi:hypothetical protein